ncbi:MAG: aminotransferase class III-fold pyridoxal phosphate-dependent enzyme, partial [Verrucomicrobiae bacterium]|nr:aminotransferase class III-fold pyridoxal phosphate-dependent enzyme [Verrucomicrobiae bacterium]
MSIHPADLDRAHVWHPFTPMGEWIASKPIILTRGKGPHLWDAQGNRYLDGNSSIWTNLHGHAHPRINRAIRRQLAQVAHVSFLGQGNVPAAQLAARLIALVQKSAPRLSKV